MKRPLDATRAARAAVLVAGLAIVAVLVPSPAAATPVHGALERALASLEKTRSPETYTGLRAVWDTWDRADPGQVEEVLRAAEVDPRLDPPSRAYAGLLASYARLRRGDVPAATAKIRALGYVDRWFIVGPFDNEGKAGLETEFGPEADLASAIVPGRAYTGKERPVRYRLAPEVFPFGYLDAGSLVRPDRKGCVFATSFVSARTSGPRREIGLFVGVAGGFKVFWNGRVVLADAADRRFDADRFAASVWLESGVNALTVKACGDESAPVLSVRLSDRTGAPDPDLVVEASLEASQRAVSTVAGVKTLPVAGTSRLKGPMQLFERLTRAPRSRAADLEAHARYLVATGGDDLAVHRARTLAEQAAEREPTVPRLLLAARLAEDRNRRARFVERAEELSRRPPAGSEDDHAVEVLLARAELVRGGPNPRPAFALYEEVRRRDPDNVEALRGQVELYNDVGLRRTALALLEGAAERNPVSLSILNMLATELRILGRATEAAEQEARYSALRGDDRTQLTRLIELAVARRNTGAAEHWVERLLGLDPDGQWALGTAARAYRALGQSERAAAMYRRALELAPEDVGTLRLLSDFEGEQGNLSEQLALLAKILEVTPQDEDVRKYVQHLEPKGARVDEGFAWSEERFKKLRHLPAEGQNRRTLLDLNVTTVFENGLSSKFRQIVFQPLTEAAAAMGRQYAFQYQADTERVQLRGARIFRGDGRVDEAIESGEGAADDPTVAMYTSARTFYVQFPRLDPGDVVELRYRVDSMTAQNQLADYFGDVVYMQSSEPVQHTEYVLVTPRSRKIYFDTARVPGLKQKVEERGPSRIYRFSAEALAAVTPEPAMPPFSSVLGYVHVSTYPGWKELGAWYWGLVKEQLDLDGETRKLAREIAAGKTTTLEKVRAVHEWVVTNTRYVALEFGIYGYKPRRCVQTVARGWGDCKDKATVVVTLLKELGIDSTLVVVRTGLRGDFDSRVASLAPFDHAIAYVPELDLYLDGTAEYSGSTELPAMDVGALGLRVNQGNAELVRLPVPDPATNLRRREVVASLRRDGSADLEVALETRGTTAPAWRRRFHAESTLRERITEDLAQDFSGFALASGKGAVTLGSLALEEPVTLRALGTAPRLARQEGQSLSIPVTLGQRLGPTYASLSTRKLPVRLPPPGTTEHTFVVKLPPGTRVVTAPAGASADTPFGSYSVGTRQEGNKVIVHSKLTTKMVVIQPADYAAWRRFAAEADTAFTPRLLIGAD